MHISHQHSFRHGVRPESQWALRPRPRSGRKHISVSIVVAVVLATVTVACGGSGSDAERGTGLPDCPIGALENAAGPVEITLWHFLSAKTGDTLAALADKYNASQSKVKVRVETQGTSSAELFSKYQAGIASNDLPAIAVMDDTVTRQMIDSDTVLPAQSCIDAEKYDMGDFLATAKAYYTVDGVLYPASLNLSSALLYLNTNHFRRAGLDPTSPPKTLSEVREAAQKIKDSGIVDKPLVLKVNPAMIEMWLTGVGQPLVDNDNGRGSGQTTTAAFDTEATVDLFTWIKQMSDDGLLEVIPDTPGQFNHYLAMGAQKASMTIETSTAATSVEAFLTGNLSADAATGQDVDIDPTALDLSAAPVPGITEPGRQQMGGGAWYMTKTTPPEVQAAAWDFMKFMNSLDSQVTWNLEASYLPYRVSAASDPRVKENQTQTLSGRWLALAYDELLNGVDPNFPGPLIGPYEQVRVAMRGAIESMTFKNTAPPDAVRTAADNTTSALTQYNDENF